MGQRHQLFVIAKVGTHYRSLAAVHHQWLYGLSALRQCILLLRIFSSEANQVSLKQELVFAEEFFRDKPVATEKQSLNWAGKQAPKLPFIQTCLMVGSGYNMTNGIASAVHDEPFGMGFDQGDNNDGITVLDITDLTSIKYCFVNFAERCFEVDDNMSEEDQRKIALLYTPLTGWQYLLNYYNRGDDIVQKNLSVPEILDTKPLVEISALSEAWPWGEWKVDQNLQEGSSLSQPLSLVEQSISKLVDAALSSDDFDCQMLDESIQNIPNFQKLVRQCLGTRDAGRVGSAPASASLLKLAYAGQDFLDWSVFRNISVGCVKTALTGPELAKAISLNISGTLAAQPGLGEALSAHGSLECLYALDKPSRENDDASVQLYSDLAKADVGLNKLVLSGALSCAIRQAKWHPEDSPLSVFPVVQLITHLNPNIDSDNPRGSPPVEYFFLGDALLSPIRAVTGLFRYLETLGDMMTVRWQGTGLAAANCFATGSSSLGVSQDVEIGPLPAYTYKIAKASYHSSAVRGCYPEMQDLVPGQWTIIVCPGSRPDETTKLQLQSQGRSVSHLDLGFKYAFVHSKSHIPATGPIEDQDGRLADLEVADMDEFLQRTMPELDTSKLQDHKNSLIRQIYGSVSDDDLKRLRSSILKCLGIDETRDLVKKFLANLPAVEKCREIAVNFGDWLV